MKPYLELCNKTLNMGEYKPSSRENLPPTLELFGERMEFSLKDGFPILTCKKMPFKTILTELLWFLRGNYNLEFLHKNNCHIWDQDGYRYYLQFNQENPHRQTFEEFSECKNTSHGNLGKIYGYQWRNWEGEVDQIYNLIFGLLYDPFSRYHVVTAWNPTDFIKYPKNAALPACHMIFQCNVRKEYDTGDNILDLSVTQRSCDLFLGVPFNITSYALLMHILCHITGYTPGKLIWFGNHVHIYLPHIPYIKILLERGHYKLPELITDDLPKFDIDMFSRSYLDDYIQSLKVEDFQLINYECYPPLKATLYTGLNKWN